MNAEWWWMMNDEWWMMMDDEWWMMNEEWWTMNDWVSHELRMMNDESRMINDEWWLPSSKCRTEKSHPFISKVSQKLEYCLATHTHTTPIPTSLCNGKHWTQSSTLLHRKRQNWSVPHPNRMNRSLSEQRTWRCYIENNKTDPFHIPTDWTVSHLNRELDVVTSKKTKLNRSTSQ